MKRQQFRPPPRPAPARFSRRTLLVTLLAVTFIVKATVLAQLNGHPLLQPAGGLDTGYYVNLAQQVAAGQDAPLGQAFYVSPLYVYFLALVFVVSGSSLLGAKIVQIILGTLAIWLIWRTALHWFGERAAWIAAALAVATGVLTFYEVILLQAAVDPFLTALALYLVTLAWSSGRRRWFLAAGVALGLHALNRPNVLAYDLVLLVLVPFAARPGDAAQGKAAAGAAGTTFRLWASQAVALACGLALVIGPVALRNHRASGEWILISSHGGLNFYIGNNPEADGTYHNVPGITPSIEGQARDANRVAEAALGHPLGPSEVSSYFYDKALEWGRANPGRAVALFARKLAYVFNNEWITLNFSYPYYAREEPTLLRVLVVGPWLLMPLGLIGLFAPRRSTAPHSPFSPHLPLSPYLPWALFVPVYGLAVAVFFVSSRYRMPLLIPLAVGAGAAGDWMWGLASARRTRELLAPAFAVAVLAVAVNWNFGLDDAAASERERMIMYYVDTRQDQAAAEMLALAERSHPNPGLLLFRVGKAYQDRGDPAAAVPLFERAERIDPARGEIQLNLGQALRDAGRPADAIPHLRRALASRVRPDLAGFDLARALAATGAHDEAVQALRAIPNGERLDAASEFAVGRFALELGEPALAEAFLRQAATRAPDKPAAHESLGLALAMLGRPQEAIAELQSAARLDPNNPQTRLNLAVTFANAGEIADARDQAMVALRLRPDYAQARQFLAALPAR